MRRFLSGDGRREHCLWHHGPQRSVCGGWGTAGVITLEAMLAILIMLPVAVGLMLFFPLFRVQQATAHALLETVESLSLDSYGADQVNEFNGPYQVDLTDVKRSDAALRKGHTSIFSGWEWEDSALPSDPEDNAGERGKLWSRLDKWYMRQNDEKPTQPGVYQYKFLPKTATGHVITTSGGNTRTYEQPKEYDARVIKSVVVPRFVLYLGGELEDATADYKNTAANRFLRTMYIKPTNDSSRFVEGRLSFAGTTLYADQDLHTYTLTVILEYTYAHPFTDFLNSPFTWTIQQQASARLWARSWD